MILYHFQVKERDEPRPRAGRAAHARVHHEGLVHVRPRRARGCRPATTCTPSAYARIFDRCGLEWYAVESDVGMMGGSAAHEYMAPCPAGENEVALAPGYAANVEVASAERAAGAAHRRSTGELAHAGHDDDRRGRRRASARSPASCSRRSRSSPSRAGWYGLRPRRPPRQRDQAAQRAAARTFRPAREDELRGPAGLPRPARRRAALSTTRRSSPGAYIAGREPARLAHASCSVDGRRAPRRAQRSRRATPSTARRSTSSPRSRSATSSSSARATPSRSARPTSTRTARSSSSGWAPTASARRASPPPRSSSSPTSRASRGRRRSRRGTSHVVARGQARAPTRPRRPRSCTPSCARSASTSCSTTAPRARARSSPTPSCSAARCG